MRILLTGTAGFIGYHTALEIKCRYPDARIVGLDNVNDYYSVRLKRDRLARLGFIEFTEGDLCDKPLIDGLFERERFDYVYHLAAQAGVRYSLISPQTYIDSNVTGFLNILEACRKYPVKHLVYASSSSVYGLNEKVPFSETDPIDRPASLYAATKKMDEAMAYAYAHLFGIKSSGLRFFTVYGPWGRPDMSPMLFADAILRGRPIQLFNYGDMQRDFTYIDDIVKAVVKLLAYPPGNLPPTEVYNIGNHQPVGLRQFVGALETALGKKAALELAPMQAGDVPVTYADTAKLRQLVGFAPATPLAAGLARFAEWYKDYYRQAGRAEA
jgi:UDP-glucuronate 4-epimerase